MDPNHKRKIFHCLLLLMQADLLYLMLLVVNATQLFAQGFDDLALTPPMGWNSWNYFGCNVSESMIQAQADAMVSSGMKDAGYQYIVIDDCWQTSRDANGYIICLLYTSPSPRDGLLSRMPSSA